MHRLAITIALFMLLSGGLHAAQPVDLVWPWLDSANSRWFFFNSATRPFGMVNLSPDTDTDGAWGSGYRYDTLEIKGFSHVHAWQLAGLSVMPVSTTAPLKALKSDFYSPFSHQRETVRPGYHRVELDRYGVEVELTASTRAGFHRYHFRQGTPRQILLPMQGKLGPVDISSAGIRRLNDREFAGFVMNDRTRRRPRPTPVFFHLRLNTPVIRVDGWRDKKIMSLVDEIEGSDIGALLTLEPGDDPVLMQVGVSYTSAEGARRNLDTEIPHWDFDRVVAEASSEWNDALSSIRIQGGTEKARSRFYTDLFHALQGRRTVSDADGRYSDQTGEERVVRQLPLDDDGRPLHAHYNSDSFWGAQWTIQTLWPLVYPEIASGMARSLLTYYRDGGYVPRGPSGGNFTYVMTGASSTPFFVSNWMKGIRDYDIEETYQALKKNHLPGGLMGRAGYEHGSTVGGGLEHYIKLGYVPHPLPEKTEGFHQDGAGQTLEYAYQDWTLAQLALVLGKKNDAQQFLERSQNYRNLFNTESGFMRPRDDDGDWREPFDPQQYQNGFVESNAAQMTWYVPQDYAGLAELMGGEDIAVQRLDQAFREAHKQGFTSGTSHDQETRDQNRRIPINYGNQPSMQTAFIFNELGAPERTQYWSRRVVDTVHSGLTPHTGYNGDEDQGLMGSLAVLMKIGLFQLDGGATPDPIYQIGSPVFDRIEIDLNSDYYPGGTFTIVTTNNAPDHVFIRSAMLNGKSLERRYLRHSEIVAGGSLELEMGAEP